MVKYECSYLTEIDPECDHGEFIGTYRDHSMEVVAYRDLERMFHCLHYHAVCIYELYLVQIYIVVIVHSYASLLDGMWFDVIMFWT